jgi:phage terminase small subunit
MKYGLLIVVILAVGYGAKWSVETLDNAILITDYWISNTAQEQWKLIQFENGKHTLYDFALHDKFTGIAKALWPVLGTFALGLIALPFLATYIYRSAMNMEIQSALDAKEQAIENQRTAEEEAQAFKQETQKWAEDKINKAYATQLKRVESELNSQWDGYHQERNALIEKEKSIAERERLIKDREAEANRKISDIQQQYQQKLRHFENEKATYTKSRNNAVHAMIRRKKKDQ